MKKELLRVKMGPGSIAMACEKFAADNTKVGEPFTIAVLGIPNDLQLEVVFRQKRVRKPKATA